MSGATLAAALHAVPVIAVLRGLAPDDATAVGLAAAAGGLRAVEVTMDSPGAGDAIAALVAAAPTGVAVGAGTVVSAADLEHAVTAGARFLVSPHLDGDLVRRAAALEVPFIPGVASPTELHAAVAAGASMVKLFPAAALGQGYLAALRGPYPQVAVMVSGGIAIDTIASWLQAGATAVGIGMATIDRHPDHVQEVASKLVGLAAEFTR